MRLSFRAPIALAALSLFGLVNGSAAVRTQAAVPVARPSGFLYWPDVHGDQVVFTSEGDLWLASLSGATPARRLTSHPGMEVRARFSPDGSMIAFNGQYDGAGEVYVMPTAGGSPVRLTFDANQSAVVGWTPDGKDVLFKSARQTNIGAPKLYAVPVKGGAPRLLPIPQVEQASMNADGARIAYVPVSADWQHWYRYRGGEADHLWMADIKARTFKRLTDFDGIDKNPVWVGNTLYFISQRDNVPNLYRMNPENGKATAVTHYRVSSYETAALSAGAPAAALSFTDYEINHLATDGKHLIYEHGNSLALYDPATEKTRELTFALPSDRIHSRPKRVAINGRITDAAVGPAGKRIVVTARGQLVSLPVQEGDSRLIAPMPGSRSHSAIWSPDGRQIAFVSDRGGEEDVWLAPAQGVQSSVRQLTHRTNHGPLGRLEWSPDGAWLAVSDREMRIALIDARTGATTLVDQSDRGGSYDATDDDYHFSPDGKWLTYAKQEPNLNSAVFLYEIATKTRTQITSDEMNAAAPAFDTDGKYLVYLADREFDPRGSGASHYFAFDRTTKVTLITLSKKTKSPYLLTNDEEGAAAAAAAAKAGVSDDPKAREDKDKAEKDKDAKKPDATDTPKLPTVTIDIDGLANRVIDVPIDAGHYGKAAIVGDRLLLLDGTDQFSTGADASSRLLALKLNKPTNKTDDSSTKPKTLLGNAVDFTVSTDGKKLLVIGANTLYVADATADSIPPTSAVDTGSQTIPVDPEAEWRQIFNEAWRIARDFYYDPKMQGVDWPAVHAKYAALLPAVADRSDLNVILGDMIAELNTGHAYVGGGDLGGGSPSVPMGYLGADLTPAPAVGGTGLAAYKIDRLFGGDGFDLGARSPLLEPGVDVHVGDFILAIGGQPVRADQDIQALLIGTPGQIVTLTVNDKPSLDGARSVQVRPHGSGSEREMRYYAWANDERAYVAKNGGPNLGYVHIPDMENDGLREFAKHYYSSLNKDAIIYDVRYNGGGYIDAMLLLQIGSKPYSYFQPRYGSSWTRQDWAFGGYSAALCNEGSGSDAEEFSDAFQRLKIGPVIGTRTWGGEVGSGGGYGLIDGGSINIPNYGEWTPDGKWVIEGSGVHPDMLVEQDPTEVLAGKDPQLDRAIAYLKERIAKNPIVHPEHPPFPNKAYLGTGDRQNGNELPHPPVPISNKPNNHGDQ